MPGLFEPRLDLDATLACLYLHQACVDARSPTALVSQLFETSTSLPGVILLETNQCAGMISRKHFFEQISRPYIPELFLKKPLHLFYKTTEAKPLILPGDTPILAAVQRALERPRHQLYEPIVVQLPDEYALLDIPHLLLAQLRIHELVQSSLKQSQQALAQEKELAQITLHSIEDAVITTNKVGDVRSLNPKAESLTGWTCETAQGMALSKVFNILHQETRKPVSNPLKTVLRKGNTVELNHHALLLEKNGREFAIDLSASPIRAKEGQIIGAVLVFRDVTQARSLARQLCWQARHDMLTTLVNRREFDRCLDQACHTAQIGQTHVLCCMDLDRFKIINDTCGHLAGDELLRQVSDLLKSWVRKSDLLARLGGDEFGLLLHQCSLAEGREVAQEIHQKIQNFRFVWQGKTFAIGVSIGLTLMDANVSAIDSFNQADAACYRAKKQGRNRIEIYQPESSHLIRVSGSPLITQIAKALEEDRFRLYYQPILPLAPDRQSSEHYEVLIRMLDETNTLLLPAAFLSTAERYHLMPAIDRWVIRTLFATQGEYYRYLWRYAQEQNLECDCLFAINLSGESINEESLVTFIQEQLTLHQIPPQLICFEITETIAISNLGKAAQVIRDLKQLGCRFALDDFGSGMSSFGYLKNLPVDYLKIDGSFVKEIAHDFVASAMVEAINHIGHVMQLKTIAECEDDETLAKVKAIGFDYAQGYKIAKPCAFTVETLAATYSARPKFSAKPGLTSVR
ncbi:EAL domain-containing protein [Phormidesmis sp. 146-35]